jgi:hypothetical protein
MKTSTKILIATMVFLVVAILGYDLLLKKEFFTGKYKNIYAKYVPLKFKDFDALQINASHRASVKIVQGPFGITADPNVLEYVQFAQNGKLLQMNVKYSAERFYNDQDYRIIISCPHLSSVNANAFVTINKQRVIDTAVSDNWNYGNLMIAGFKQDSLKLTQDYGSQVILANNNIGKLKAIVGVSDSSQSRLTILKSNKIDNARLQILNRSRLSLNEARIGYIEYLPADSSQLILNGAAQKLLQANIHPKQ